MFVKTVLSVIIDRTTVWTAEAFKLPFCRGLNAAVLAYISFGSSKTALIGQLADNVDNNFRRHIPRPLRRFFIDYSALH
jgi:hypothetical protein